MGRIADFFGGLNSISVHGRSQDRLGSVQNLRHLDRRFLGGPLFLTAHQGGPEFLLASGPGGQENC